MHHDSKLLSNVTYGLTPGEREGEVASPALEEADTEVEFSVRDTSAPGFWRRWGAKCPHFRRPLGPQQGYRQEQAIALPPRRPDREAPGDEALHETRSLAKLPQAPLPPSMIKKTVFTSPEARLAIVPVPYTNG